MVFEELGEIPADYRVSLVDLDLQIPIDLQESDWRLMTNMGVTKNRQYRLLVGTDSYISQQLAGLPLVPADFELKQNYPNPFNMSTTLQFGIPEAGNVYLDIYNILGQKVRTLLSGQNYQPGYHLVEWDGRNDAVRQLPAAYIYSESMPVLR